MNVLNLKARFLPEIHRLAARIFAGAHFVAGNFFDGTDGSGNPCESESTLGFFTGYSLLNSA